MNTSPIVKDPMGDKVAEAYFMTTQAQREAVVEDWTEGRQRTHEAYAELLHIDPTALALASLLEAEHESVCGYMGRPRSTNYGELAELMIKHKPEPTVTVERP